MRKHREKVWNKYGKKCAYCGCEIELKQMQVDHIHPKICGGEDVEENFNPACRRCNMWKSSLSIEEFRTFISNQPKNLMRDRGSMRIAYDYGLVVLIQKQPTFYFETLPTT